MKKTRIIALLMALAITGTAFSGCQGSPASSQKEVSSKEASTSMVSSKAASEVSTKQTDQRLGKIIIFQNIGKVQASGKPGSNTQDFDAVKAYIEEATNIELEVIIPASGEEENKLNMMLAANEPIDVFWGDYTKYAKKGAIQPITDQISTSGADIVAAWNKESISQMTDSSGKIWGIPRLAPLAVFPIWLRTDWLKQVGKEAPKTIDELEEVLRLFKEKDPAGNGSTIPLLTNNEIDCLNMCLAGGYLGRGYGYYKDDDGKVKPSVLDPNYKTFVEKMASWYESGYIFRESFATEQGQAWDMIKRGNIGGTAMVYASVTLRAPYLTENDPNATYTLCAPIEGPKGHAQTLDAQSGYGALIPSTSKNADLVVKYINWAYENIENHIVAENGLKDVNWKYTDEATHTIEALNSDYVGEFVVSQGIVNEQRYGLNDPMMKIHYDYLHNSITKLDDTVQTNVSNVLFDKAAISIAVTNYQDIERMTKEGIISFITGTRDLKEYDAFIKELYNIGIEKEIEELTLQYNAVQ